MDGELDALEREVFELIRDTYTPEGVETMLKAYRALPSERRVPWLVRTGAILDGAFM